jgi:hypothetical protein
MKIGKTLVSTATPDLRPRGKTVGVRVIGGQAT